MDFLRRLNRPALILAGLLAVIALLGVTWLVAADRTPLHEIPKRLAQGKELKLEHWMAIGFRRAAIASVIIGVLGPATVGWWGRTRAPEEAAGHRNDGAANPGNRKQLLWAVSLSLLVGAGLRVPRLFHSFWNDEAYAARAYVWGVKEPQADGSLVFKPVPWSQALFLNEKGNNHVWCSLEARLALKLWQSLTGRGADRFSEAAMRVPAFFWGLLTIAAISLLATMVAGPRGWLAGLLLAVHPWHVRFSVEMRGYSAMLLALILGMVFLLLALRDGRWRWWLLAAGMNLWALLAFAGCVYVPLVANAVALGWLLWKHERIPAGRLLLANSLAAIPFLWLYGPSLPQLTAYLKSGADAATYQIDTGWFKSLWSCLCLGADWRIMSEAWWGKIALRAPLAQAVALWGASVLSIVQFIRWLRLGRRAALVPLAFFLAGLLGIAQNMLTHSPVVVWYFLPMMLGWVLIMIGPPPGGLEGTGLASRRAWGMIACIGIACIGIACLLGNAIAFAGLEHQPMRSAADHAGAGADSPLTAAIGVSDRQILIYDPRVTIVRTMGELEKVEVAAAAAGKPLLVYVCGWEESERRVPDVMVRLRGGGYQTVAGLPGWEAMFSYRVLRKIE